MAYDPLLILCLEGLMQSWGERARWDSRDTNTFPTKSGVIGLIACAMGLERGDAVIRELAQEVIIGVRADRAGVLMTDFQTITGDFITAEGKRRVKKGEIATILSPRQYIFDAAFLVVAAGPTNRLEHIAAALQKPKWQIYLGRKCCVPSRPVFETITQTYASVDEALHLYPLNERADSGPVFLCELEDATGSYIRRDHPLVTPSRQYQSRRINKFAVKVLGEKVGS